jgi:hypothetical protein
MLSPCAQAQQVEVKMNFAAHSTRNKPNRSDFWEIVENKQNTQLKKSLHPDLC